MPKPIPLDPSNANVACILLDLLRNRVEEAKPRGKTVTLRIAVNTAAMMADALADLLARFADTIPLADALSALPTPPSRSVVEAAIDEAIEAGAAIVVEVFADDERFFMLDEARTVTRAALLALIFPEPTP